MKHGSARTYVALHHYNPAHRLTVCVGSLRTELASTVKLSVDEFVVCAVLHGTDFVDRSSKGVPHWGKYLKGCGQFLRHTGGRLVTEGEENRAVLNSTVAYRMLSYAAKVSRWDADHLRGLAWNVDYWLAEPARAIKPVAAGGPAEEAVMQPGGPAEEAVMQPGGPAEEAVMQPGGPAEAAVMEPGGPAEAAVMEPGVPAEAAVMQPENAVFV